MSEHVHEWKVVGLDIQGCECGARTNMVAREVTFAEDIEWRRAAEAREYLNRAIIEDLREALKLAESVIVPGAVLDVVRDVLQDSSDFGAAITDADPAAITPSMIAAMKERVMTFGEQQDKINRLASEVREKDELIQKLADTIADETGATFMEMTFGLRKVGGTWERCK